MNSCFPCKGNAKETITKLQRDFPEMPPSNIQKIGLYAISRETELLTKKRKMKLFLLFHIVFFLYCCNSLDFLYNNVCLICS